MVQSLQNAWYPVTERGNDLAEAESVTCVLLHVTCIFCSLPLMRYHLTSLVTAYFIIAMITRVQAALVSGHRKRKYTSGGFPQATISSLTSHIHVSLLAVIIYEPLSLVSLQDVMGNYFQVS